MMPLFLVSVYALAADPAGYAKPELLVEPDALTTPEGAAKFRILDLRSAAKYEAGHVPGAVNAPLSKWSKAVTAKTADAAFWKAELAAVGVPPRVPVVVYADDVRETCRGWWLLTQAGVPDVRVLNGGWQAYQAANGPTDTKPTTAPAAPHDWTLVPARRLDKEDVLEKSKSKSEKIIDARSADEFKAGRVPGATWLEWSELIDPKTKKFLPPAELRKVFKDRDLDPTAGGCVYCQSGGRASVVAFGMELLGAKGAKNYYRSWSEWGTDKDTPKEK